MSLQLSGLSMIGLTVIQDVESRSNDPEVTKQSACVVTTRDERHNTS